MKLTIESQFEVRDIVKVERWVDPSEPYVEIVDITLNVDRNIWCLCEFLNGERKLIREDDLKRKVD